MRWLIGIAAAIVTLALLWLGSAGVALSGLAAAARAGDGAAVLARTDLAALKRSLSEQVVAAYLQQASETRAVRPAERLLANTYGASIADALIGKLLTATNLTQLLKAGTVTAPEGPAVTGVPAVAELQIDTVSALGRFTFVSPATFRLRIGEATDPDNLTEIEMHREWLDWKLAGLRLPRSALRQLVAGLPVR